MAKKYVIVAARPKNASNHLNSEFRLCEWNATKDKWVGLGWQRIAYVTALMEAGHVVLTGQIADDVIKTGAAVEVELRIAKNDTQYKISDMPDA